MQMPKGREMLLLARLRSELECFSLDAQELIADEKLCQDSGSQTQRDHQYDIADDMRCDGR